MTHPALAAVSHRLVRRVVATDMPAAQALFDIAARDRRDWTPESWACLLKELDNCSDKVSDWLAINA